MKSEIGKVYVMATVWTGGITAGALAGLVPLERWLMHNFYACLGSGLPAPSQAVIDATRGDASILLSLVPVGLSIAGMRLRSTSPRLAALLVYVAPQLALVAAMMTTLALFLPMLSIAKCSHLLQS